MADHLNYDNNLPKPRRNSDYKQINNNQFSQYFHYDRYRGQIGSDDYGDPDKRRKTAYYNIRNNTEEIADERQHHQRNI